MNILFISPRLAVQKGDILGSGVPYWPIELVTLATSVLMAGDQVKVLDLFSEGINIFEESYDYYLQGSSIKSSLKNNLINLDEFNLIIIFAISYMSHREINAITSYLKKYINNTKIVILENSQAVTSYDIFSKRKDFFDSGADALICGNICQIWIRVREDIINLKDQAEEVVYSFNDEKKPKRFIGNEVNIPIPKWDLINYKEYWKIPYSHGPKLKKYLPILTSRGCPYPCDFCVVPNLNDQKWRGKDPDTLIKEIIFLRDAYNVKDFHIEDLNPTINSKRWIEVSKKLIDKKVGIRYYFVSGTKGESLSIKSLPLIYKSGCRYISISPESGDKNVLKEIGKNVDYDHLKKLLKTCYSLGIKTQACFLIGHPGENYESQNKNEVLLKSFLKNGLSEAAFFIVAPLPGSKIEINKKIKEGEKNYLTSFTPKNRPEYNSLEKSRRSLIFIYLKSLCYSPKKLFKILFRAFISSPKTKIENLPKRVFFLLFWISISNLRILILQIKRNFKYNFNIF